MFLLHLALRLQLPPTEPLETQVLVADLVAQLFSTLLQPFNYSKQSFKPMEEQDLHPDLQLVVAVEEGALRCYLTK